MRIGILGSGSVGETLANGFLKHGHEVMRGSRDPQKLGAWLSTAASNAHTGDFAATARFGDIVILAVKGEGALSAIEAAGADNLAGKPVIDATNPIASAPPEHGVIKFFTDLNESLMERLQNASPRAHFVKAFSCVGNALMIDPKLAGGPPTMFICGNDADAKAKVVALLSEVGWESLDLGHAAAARAIEPLCILWCIPGFLNNDWMHALKMLRA